MRFQAIDWCKCLSNAHENPHMHTFGDERAFVTRNHTVTSMEQDLYVNINNARLFFAIPMRKHGTATAHRIKPV
jgi:hypothetical protein